MTNVFAVVEVPALGVTLDVSIPTHLTTTQVVSLLTKIVYATIHVKLDENKLMLCDVDSGRVLCETGSILNFHLKDACRLAII